MNVTLVTTWGTACGLAEFAAYLDESIRSADGSITHHVVQDLHPTAVLTVPPTDLLVLNYGAAVLSQWHPEHIRAAQARGQRTVVIYHDSGVPNTEQCKALHAVADAFVVHEPVEDLPGAIYWRMGVPGLKSPCGVRSPFWSQRPIVGTVGHDFPWKCWDQLAIAAAAVGWGLLICTPAITAEHEAALHAANPWLTVRVGVQRDQVLADLHACDATAYTFVCHNAGQSASILQGIGARKPVIAFRHCRQMRALYDDPLGHRAIRWCDTFDDVQGELESLQLGRFDAPTVALAEQESWATLGQRYVELYHSMVRR